MTFSSLEAVKLLLLICGHFFKAFSKILGQNLLLLLTVSSFAPLYFLLEFGWFCFVYTCLDLVTKLNSWRGRD